MKLPQGPLLRSPFRSPFRSLFLAVAMIVSAHGQAQSLGAVVPHPAPVAAQVPNIQRLASLEGITEYRLANNGFRFLLLPDASVDTVTVNMTYLVGSRQEGYGESGMAHLLEHLLFKGTPRFPNILALLQKRGAQFNGTTSYDRTNYYETLTASADNLDWALALEADRMVNSHVSKQDLD